MIPLFSLLAYLAPETALPATSILVAALGIVMMFGRRLARLMARYARPGRSAR